MLKTVCSLFSSELKALWCVFLRCFIWGVSKRNISQTRRREGVARCSCHHSQCWERPSYDHLSSPSIPFEQYLPTFMIYNAGFFYDRCFASFGQCLVCEYVSALEYDWWFCSVWIEFPDWPTLMVDKSSFCLLFSSIQIPFVTTAVYGERTNYFISWTYF